VAAVPAQASPASRGDLVGDGGFPPTHATAVNAHAACHFDRRQSLLQQRHRLMATAF